MKALFGAFFLYLMSPSGQLWCFTWTCVLVETSKMEPRGNINLMFTASAVGERL